MTWVCTLGIPCFRFSDWKLVVLINKGTEFRAATTRTACALCKLCTGVWGMVRPLLTVLARDMMGYIYIYICCRRPLPQNLEISSEFQTMLHVVKSCLKCSLNENCTNVNNPQAISQVKIQKQETFKYNVPICSIILRHVLCKCWSRGLPAKTKLLLPGVFYQVGRGLS